VLLGSGERKMGEGEAVFGICLVCHSFAGFEMQAWGVILSHTSE